MAQKEEGKKATAPKTAVPETPKEALYVSIAEFVEGKTGKKIGKTGGHELFDLMVAGVFAAAVNGGFRFNRGYGSMALKTYGAGSRKLPSGQDVTFGERQKLRYEEGQTVKQLVVGGGVLPAKPAKEANPKAAKKDAKPAKAAASSTDKASEVLNLD